MSIARVHSLLNELQNCTVQGWGKDTISYISQTTGSYGISFHLHALAHSLLVWSRWHFVVTCDPCPGHSEQGCRPLFEEEPTLQRLVLPLSGSGFPMGEIKSENTHCSMFFSLRDSNAPPAKSPSTWPG